MAVGEGMVGVTCSATTLGDGASVRVGVGGKVARFWLSEAAPTAAWDAGWVEVTSGLGLCGACTRTPVWAGEHPVENSFRDMVSNPEGPDSEPFLGCE